MNLEIRLYNILAFTTIYRETRPEKVRDLDGTMIPAWVRQERLALLEAVNVERAKYGFKSVTEADVRRGEQVGDPNYGKKLAEFCAALVVEP